METKQEQSEANLNVIFLIGNGYDLYNRLKTNYEDFINWYIQKSLNEIVSIDKYFNYDEHPAYSDDCIEIYLNKTSFITNMHTDNYLVTQLQNEEISDFIAEDSIKYHITQTSKSFIIKPKNTLVKTILIECSKKNWSGIEHAIYTQIRHEYSELTDKIDKIKIDRNKVEAYKSTEKKIQSINSSIHCLKDTLIKYLQTQNSTKLKTDVLTNPNVTNWYNRKKDKITSALFLNFNYTNYIERKLNIDLKSTTLEEGCKFINIHGSLDDDIDEIIFGIGDEQEDFLKVIESYFGDEWLKPMKSFFYLKNQKYQNLLGFIAKGDYEIYIVGHSCSITDRTLLKMLFENEYCKKIHVMHHKGMTSYLTSAYNISRNFDDKIKLRQVLQPFDPNLRLNSEF